MDEIILKSSEGLTWLDMVGHIFQEDCRITMKNMLAATIDITVTDPPYGINYKSNLSTLNIHQEIANDEELFFPLDELWRVTKMSGAIFAFFSHKKPLIDKRVKNEIIWVKNGLTAGDLEGDFANQYEKIAFIPREDFKIKGKRYSNVWMFDRQPAILHPTQKPLDLISRMVAQGRENGVVYDPFAGSGTTLVAAELSKRRWIGSELKEEYCKVVEKRILECRQQLSLDL